MTPSDRYAEYISGTHWKELNKRVKARAGYRCQVCDSPHDLQAHHRRYDNRGNESLDDMICLCRRCHSIFHGKLEPDQPTVAQGRKHKKNDAQITEAQQREIDAMLPDGDPILMTSERVNQVFGLAPTNATLRQFGLKHPLEAGWKYKIVGKMVSRNAYRLALEGKFILSSPKRQKLFNARFEQERLKKESN